MSETHKGRAQGEGDRNRNACAVRYFGVTEDENRKGERKRGKGFANQTPTNQCAHVNTITDENRYFSSFTVKQKPNPKVERNHALNLSSYPYQFIPQPFLLSPPLLPLCQTSTEPVYKKYELCMYAD